MSFTTPDYTAIRDGILRDIANLLPEASIGSDSDYAVRAQAVAAGIEGLYQHQLWLLRQVFPDTADSDWLERHAALNGLARKPAAVAGGTIALTGMPGALVPSGTQASSSSGARYVTMASGAIGGGGTLTIAAQALAGGSAGNAAAGTPLTLSSAPAGVASAATIVTMASGTDIETDAALLARLLDLIRQAPAGGNRYDYLRWAYEVPGVTSAFVFPLRRGPGTVDVAVLSDGALPSPELLATVQTHIATLRPVTADCLVLAPQLVPVNIVAGVALAGSTLTAATAVINAGLAAYFASLAPGATVLRSRIGIVLADAPGVVDYEIASPATSRPMLVDAGHLQLATLGSVVIT